VSVKVLQKGHQFTGNTIRVWKKNERGEVEEDLTCRMDLIVSLFQKAIRFCLWDYCALAIVVYYQTGFGNAVFTNLKEFACEDKGRFAPELVARVDRLHTLFKQKFTEKIRGRSFTSLPLSQCQEIFPEGIKYALAAGYEVCRAPTSRIAAMLAFSGLSQAVLKTLGSAHVYGTDQPPHLNEMLEKMRWAWEQPKGKLKVRPYEETVRALCEGHPGLFEKLKPVTNHRLSMATAIVATLSPADPTELPPPLKEGEEFEVWIPSPFDLPEWVYDKHTKEGKERLNSTTRLPDEDLPSRYLRHAFESSFECYPDSVYDYVESERWNFYGRLTYEWWDLYHKNHVHTDGKLRTFSLAKTNRLLAYWEKVKRSSSFHTPGVHTYDEFILPDGFDGSPFEIDELGIGSDGISAEILVIPKITPEKSKRRAKKAVASSSSSLRFPSQREVIIQGGQYNVNEAGAFRIKTVGEGVQIGNITNGASSSSVQVGNIMNPKRKRDQKEESSAKRKPGKKSIHVPDKLIDEAHCLVQLPTRAGKQITLFKEDGNGHRWWYKGPYPPDQDVEARNEKEADRIFKELPGVEGRGVRLVHVEGIVWIRCPALGWPESTETKWCSMLQRDVKVAKFAPNSPIRPLSSKDFPKLSTRLLSLVFHAQLLKWALGCNDLVPRNLLVDFENERVYPCDCTLLSDKTQPDMIRSSAAVKELLLSDQVSLVRVTIAKWVKELDFSPYHRAFKHLDKVLMQGKSILFSK